MPLRTNSPRSLSDPGRTSFLLPSLPTFRFFLLSPADTVTQALYKIGTGEDFDKAPAPGMFDLKGKAKYNAWSAAHKEDSSAENAQKKYVELVERLKNQYGYDAAKVPEAVGSA
jgi:diazepam-binding inhibitor (GABA receptor modulator, acyl-CoA-binding protein)